MATVSGGRLLEPLTVTRGVEVMAGACTDGREARGLADPSGEELRAEPIPLLPPAAAHSSARQQGRCRPATVHSVLAELQRFRHTATLPSREQRFQQHTFGAKSTGVQGLAQLATELAGDVTKQRMSADRRHCAPGVRGVAKLSAGLASR